MLRDNKDIELLETLITSLNKWQSKNKTDFKHTEHIKETGSLYRFGYWYFYDTKYSISGWKFRDGIVTFENEQTGEKVKYSIDDAIIKNGKFSRDGLLTKIRKKISQWLKDLSDKLHP